MNGGYGAAPAVADHALLDRTVRGALRWLDGMRPSFRLPPDVATDADPNTTLKPLGELAELTHLIRVHHPQPDVRALAEGLFAFSWDETRDGTLFAELVRGEPQATYPVELYGVFAQAGLRNQEVEALLEATTGLRQWRVAREDHTRTLGVLNALRRIGLPQHADFGSVLAMTGLGARPEPWALDRKAAYGITHDVFHLTDWGRARHRMAAPPADYLRLWLPAWLETWYEERLWDLVGELLAVTACLPDAPYETAAWERLTAAQTPEGAVPEMGEPPLLGCAAREAFTACYHSTLVVAFAATLARVAAEPASPSLRPEEPLRESEATP